MNLEPLRAALRALDEAGVESALGGSGLVSALGYEIDVHDWDLTTDAPLDRVRDALAGFEPEIVGPGDLHADSKLRLDGGAIEVIVGFAIRSDAGVVRLPTLVTGWWNGIPLGSPEVWASAYALLGRREKSARLFGHLERHAARTDAVDRLLAQPLPDELRATLRGLSRGGELLR